MPYRIRLKSQPDRLVLDNSNLASNLASTPSAEWQPIRATDHSARRLAPLAFPGQVLLGLAEQPPYHAPARRPARPADAPAPANAATAAAALALRNASTTRLLRDLAGTARRLTNLLTGGKGLRILHGAHRRLQVTETVQLGEKRFVAILRVDGEQFLIGGSATGVSLLSNLQPAAQPSRIAFAPEASTAPTSPSSEPDSALTADPAPTADPASFEAILAARHSAEGAA